MDSQNEFANAMKSRLAAEIGNLFIAVVEAQAARDMAVKQFQELERSAASRSQEGETKP